LFLHSFHVAKFILGEISTLQLVVIAGLLRSDNVRIEKWVDRCKEELPIIEDKWRQEYRMDRPIIVTQPAVAPDASIAHFLSILLAPLLECLRSAQVNSNVMRFF